jgi:hypothetical protein
MRLHKIAVLFFAILIHSYSLFSQSRIEYNNRDLFLSGSNVAWVNFARDIGPGSTNLNRFSQIFAEMKAAGGNSFRLWLHTTGETTPEFSSTTDMVVGPGSGALQDLQQILDLAWQNDVGLMLCLWSHDMMATSRTAILDRNEKLLTDTTAIRAYINNALIPMVEAAKGHPGILAWEIFNEPEGFTEIGNWGDRRHVTQFDVQRFVNMTAGAIHRADPTVQVTNGVWGLQALTDVATLSKLSPKAFYDSLNQDQKRRIEREFATKYGVELPADQIIERFNSGAANYNFYTDARLIAAGGDPDGTLDFYTVHYYSWAQTALSPFHHPFSYWQLDKPLAIAEFFMEDAYGVSYEDLYEQLYSTGYAGALSWQWWGDTQANDSAKNNNHSRTTATLQYMYHNYPNDIVVTQQVGTIYTFEASPAVIEAGESVTLRWITATGSTPFLNGAAVEEAGTIIFSPDSTTVFTLITNNDVADTVEVTVEVLLSGIIHSFTAFPIEAASGEIIQLEWATTNNSIVRLNDGGVAEEDSMQLTLDSTTTFELIAEGATSDTAAITVRILPAGEVNRALHRNLFASSGANPEFIADGNFDTFWRSAAGGSQWAHVNLEKEYLVEKIILKWGTDFARSFRVVNFTHPIYYEVLLQKDNAAGGIDTIHVNDTLRNLRVFMSQNSTRYSIREIEVYGVPANTTNVEDSPLIVENFQLYQNYPNPFNPETTIKFHIPTEGLVTLKIYDVRGREVATLIDDEQISGTHSTIWNPHEAASGIYFCQLAVKPVAAGNTKSASLVETRRMVYLK